jgi:hypothetical protein
MLMYHCHRNYERIAVINAQVFAKIMALDEYLSVLAKMVIAPHHALLSVGSTAKGGSRARAEPLDHFLAARVHSTHKIFAIIGARLASFLLCVCVFMYMMGLSFGLRCCCLRNLSPSRVSKINPNVHARCRKH